MSATSSSSFPLATEDPYTGGGSSSADTSIDNDGGASGSSDGSMSLSRGGLVAIIVVVVAVAIIGVTSAVLFYLAKKREWKIRQSIRKSARRVVNALTPRRSEFPKSAKEGTASNSRGRVRLDDVPPTPRLPVDLEKGFANSDKKKYNFHRK
ncbi:hypothetical protein CMQ_6011 [Grosmannia clavigera kw1407]|uniref:Uncharacterized protein n=1 Tax=Grosmannia clavigera (strain kw1407 / UAMH 11150) TaxID=655863 RepID=F0XLW9_GROCL|nr:uncharacterized protein CMQ_6011 [Grosmannia clavigera kw1407]EFX01069.1 hypothetical protein CMQ_6011 [Grosmannia clavigera kw1407]